MSISYNLARKVDAMSLEELTLFFSNEKFLHKNFPRSKQQNNLLGVEFKVKFYSLTDKQLCHRKRNFAIHII